MTDIVDSLLKLAPAIDKGCSLIRILTIFCLLFLIKCEIYHWARIFVERVAHPSLTLNWWGWLNLCIVVNVFLFLVCGLISQCCGVLSNVRHLTVSKERRLTALIIFLIIVRQCFLPKLYWYRSVFVSMVAAPLNILTLTGSNILHLPGH